MGDRTRTPGQVAYEAECERHPTYHDGTPRKRWHELDDTARWSWERRRGPVIRPKQEGE